MGIDDPRAWTLAVHYIKRMSSKMQAAESSLPPDDMASCRYHTLVVNSDDPVGLHWLVCGMDCCLPLSTFTP